MIISGKYEPRESENNNFNTYKIEYKAQTNQKK